MGLIKRTNAPPKHQREGGRFLIAVMRNVPPRRARPLAGHADAEDRRSVLTALPCATLVTVPTSLGEREGVRGTGS